MPITLSAMATALIAMGVTLPATAQEAFRRYDEDTQLWRQTSHAAALQLDRALDRGYAQLEATHTDGDYHRVQEGGQRNQLTFTTERIQKVGKYLTGYGRFQFDMDRTKNRSWADVMRPYNSNPFFGGSSISGKYDLQQFDLTAALGTAGFGGWRFGGRLDYKVADLSRLRDPRSRSELLHYRLTPSLAYTAGIQTLSLAAHYDRRKEKIPNMTTVQQDPGLYYYQMSGLEQVSGALGGYSGYQREWVRHQLGAELAYAVDDRRLSSVTTVGLSRGVEDAWGQYKFSPGRFTTLNKTLTSRTRIYGDRLLHLIDLSVSAGDAYADEYRQVLVQERDAEKGYTSYRYDTQIEYRKRYQLKTRDLSLHYRMDEMATGSAISAYAGATLALSKTSATHLLPTSQFKQQRATVSLESGHALLHDRLWIDAVATYSHATKARLDLAQPSTIYATSVLQPDMDYYNADYGQGSLSLKYIFDIPHLAAGKHPAKAYVKLSGQYLRTDNHLSRRTIGLTLGMYN